MKMFLRLASILLAVVAFSLFLDSCSSPTAVGVKRQPRGSLLNPEKTQTPTDDQTKAGNAVSQEEAESSGVDDQESANKTKVFVSVAKLNNTPASLKLPVVKQVLSKDAPEKYVYKYKYIYKGNLQSSKDFPYADYLTKRGQPAGKYPGDAVVISGGKRLYVFSNKIPDSHWFLYEEK